MPRLKTSDRLKTSAIARATLPGATFVCPGTMNAIQTTFSTPRHINNASPPKRYWLLFVSAQASMCKRNLLANGIVTHSRQPSVDPNPSSAGLKLACPSTAPSPSTGCELASGSATCGVAPARSSSEVLGGGGGNQSRPARRSSRRPHHPSHRPMQAQ